MVYELDNKKINIPDKEIDHLMTSLSISKSEAIECWLEDNLSLAYKMELVKQADVAGTAAWKLTQERDNFFNIINMNIEN